MVAPPPDVAEHNDEVLKEFGCSAQEIEELRKAKAI
jgi:crotonobetainyl-CoA:carnitine CoA-transferase CaiB-like acyl-CoA transferase